MSWLFGIKKDAPSDLTFPPGLPNVQQPPPEPEKPKDTGEDDEIAKTMGYHFDPSGLERAAKTAKDFDVSQNTHQTLNVYLMRETSIQSELQTKLKEYEAENKNKKVEKRQIEQEERRRTAAEKAQHNREVAQAQDQIARKRYEDQLILQRQVAEENRRKQEEFAAKQELMKKAASEREVELRSQADMKRIEGKYYGKAKADRENQGFYLKQISAEAAEHRATVLETIKTAGSVIGTGFDNFISDWEKVSTTITGAVLLALGVYSAKLGTGIAARYAEAYFSKPSLVRETSRLTLFSAIRHPVKTAKILMTTPKDVMRGVILKPELEERLAEFAVAAYNTRKNKGTYQHLLMSGPPGTGKTLFAKRLAQHCGMDYAVMTGGDVSPMGKDGVTALNKLFDWASTSRRGLLLFIDEAEAFLRKRSSEVISEPTRSTLNAFLNRTGEHSNKFMLVLASNIPEQIDWAVIDRIGEVIELELPGLEERTRLLHFYFDKCVLAPATQGKRLKVEHFDYGELCAEIAEITEGFSGRAISQLGSAWEVQTFESEEGVLTRKMIMDSVHNAIQQHKQMALWLSAEEKTKIDAEPKIDPVSLAQGIISSARNFGIYHPSYL